MKTPEGHPHGNHRGPARGAHDDPHGMDQQHTSPATPPHDGPAAPHDPDGPHGSDAAYGCAASQGGAASHGGAAYGGDAYGNSSRGGDAPDDGAAYGETAGEAELRALMRDAVEGLRGSPDALEHLRRAVPARRRRRRQARVGAVAALVVVGMAVPALVHVARNVGGSDTTAADVAGSHSPSPDVQGYTQPWNSGGPSEPPVGVGPGPRHTPGGPSAGASSTPGGGTAPDCTSTQLGQASSAAGAPDASGRVYGWFRVVNISGTACSVPDGGVVHAVAGGAADPARIQVLAHTASDPASELPIPATPGPVVLAPGQDYELAFAWVPDTSVGPGGCPVPSPPPTSAPPSDSPSASPSAAPTAGGVAPAAMTDGSAGDSGGSGPPPSGSITLDHTPAAGAPVIDGPVIQDACGGTVYTAVPIPESTTGPATTSPSP